LQALFDENLAQMLEELAEANIDDSTVSDHLHAMGKIKKEGKFHMNCLNWLFKIIQSFVFYLYFIVFSS